MFDGNLIKQSNLTVKYSVKYGIMLCLMVIM